MIEKTLSLESVEPIEFFGVNDANIDQLKLFFPKLRIVARGSEVKVAGEAEQISAFEDKFTLLLKYFDRYNSISPIVIKEMLENTFEGNIAQQNKPEDLILYGNRGRAVKARTQNQMRLVELQQKNDLVFAIGPAGSGKTYTAVALAVNALRNRIVKRIILCRPAVEAEESLGFLPGDMRDKLNPYFNLYMMHYRT